MAPVTRRRLLAFLTALGVSAGTRLTAWQRDDARYPSVGPGHFIKERREGGRFLVLEDKSLWEIAEPNRHAVAGWQELDGISVRLADGDPPFTYELSNIDRDEGAAARWVRPER